MWAEASWSSRASGAGDKCRRPGSVARTTAQDRHADATSKTHDVPGDQGSSPDARQGASDQERDMCEGGKAKSKGQGTVKGLRRAGSRIMKG